MSNSGITASGIRYWYNSKNQYHREDGPAWIGTGGTQEWALNGKIHRIDGPAIIRSNGTVGWYVNSKQIFTNKDFQQAANLSDEEMTALILKYGNISHLGQ